VTLVAPRPPHYPEVAAELARTGTTTADLSHVVGCHSGHLSQIIRGHAKPSKALKQRIADALGRPIDELFAEGAQ
jgi:transcriptional regulator with XRE-family HTH domain